MGGIPSKVQDAPTPNPKNLNANQCSNALGDVVGGETLNLCFPNNDFSFDIYDNKATARRQFCKSIGGAQEWDLGGRSQKCCTLNSRMEVYGKGFADDNCNNFFDFEDNNLSDGQYTDCKRISFAADPLTCCLLDNDCFTTDPDAPTDTCWETKSRQKTCAPEYRDLSGDECLELLKPYCLGAELLPGQSNWWDLWVKESGVEIKADVSEYIIGDSYFIPDDIKFDPSEESRYFKQPCMRALARAMTRDNQFCTWESIQDLDIRRGNYDPVGLKWSQEVVTGIFDRYINQFGSFVGGVNTKGVQIGEMGNVFYEICKKFPALCQDSLPRICENISAETLVNIPTADTWCGCYMPDNEYQKYTDNYGIGKECTPFCNNPNTIPLVDPDGYEKICRHDICIIDNLKLNFVRVRNQDDDNKVTFNQVCGGCGGINIDQKITGAQDFNTKRTTLSGLYSQTINDRSICRTVSVAKPDYIARLFPNNQEEVVVTMKSVETGNEILVTLGQESTPVGGGTGVNVRSEWSLTFKNSSSLNEDYLFTNGEEMEIINIDFSIPCKLYAITVIIQYGGTNSEYNNGDATVSISTRYLFRSRETYGNQCTCIIENSTVDIVDSRFGDLNLYQNCGAQICTNDDNEQIPCQVNDVQNDANYYTPEEAIDLKKKEAQQKSINIVGIIVFALFILFALIAIGVGFGNKSSVKNDVTIKNPSIN